MKYIIESTEVVKEGMGEKGPWKKSAMTLRDEEGKMVENVATFLEVSKGQELEGSIEKNEKYHSLEFKKTLNKPNFMKKPVDFSKVMEKKEASIGRFQDNKELSIKIASTINKAVDLAIAEKTDPTVLDTLEQGIIKWREWLWTHWDAEDKDFPPF